MDLRAEREEAMFNPRRAAFGRAGPYLCGLIVRPNAFVRERALAALEVIARRSFKSARADSGVLCRWRYPFWPLVRTRNCSSSADLLADFGAQ
jgi:hypothetical protein